MARFTLTREFYTPKNAVKVTDKLSDAVAYLYTSANGKPAARLFAGKAAKPISSFYYKDETGRNNAVLIFFEARRKALSYKAERRAARKAEGRGVKVGDVLRCSWGYDQTNVDYYECTALIGSTMVELREIAQKTIGTGFMSGKCAPLVGEYTGQPFRRIAKGGCVKLAKWGKYARVQTPETVAGVKIYDASYWSNYA